MQRKIAALRIAGTIWLVALVLLATPVPADDQTATTARAGLGLAAEAARAWAPDASLIYVENDEPLDPGGAALRWGYLYYSPALDKARAYSVQGGRIVLAENLEVKFEAPPLVSDWMDSGAALEVAEREAGREFRRQHGGQLGTMLLMRGAFQDAQPDQTTWTFVYNSPGAPSLFVVVDASAGKVRRTWRG
jgi:hypothetical protein